MPTDTRESNIADVLLPHARDLLIKLAREYGYDDPRFVARKGAKAGEGYMSLSIKVQIRSNNNPDMEPLSVLFKCAPQSKELRDAFTTDKLFQNEDDVFCKILPAFAEFLYEKGAIKEKNFPNTPRFYTSISAGDETDCLVFEDLTVRKFGRANRHAGLSAEQLRLTVAALARLHATSRAYEIEKPEQFEKMKSNLYNFFQETKCIDGFYDTAHKMIDLTTPRFPEGTIEYKKYREFFANFKDEIKRLISPDPDGFNVFAHADCWANNMMFITDPDTGIPQEVVLIDFQHSRYCSPVIDLCYVIFLGCTREARGDISELLSHYVNEFNTIMRAVKCETQMISLPMLNQEMKKYGRAGLAFGTLFLKIMLSESNAVPEFNEGFEGSGDVAESLNFECKNIEDVVGRLVDILEDTVKLGYL